MAKNIIIKNWFNFPEKYCELGSIYKYRGIETRHLQARFPYSGMDYAAKSEVLGQKAPLFNLYDDFSKYNRGCRVFIATTAVRPKVPAYRWEVYIPYYSVIITKNKRTKAYNIYINRDMFDEDKPYMIITADNKLVMPLPMSYIQSKMAPHNVFPDLFKVLPISMPMTGFSDARFIHHIEYKAILESYDTIHPHNERVGDDKRGAKFKEIINKHTHQYYPGITFDLLTGEHIVSGGVSIDSDRSKKWRILVREFNSSIKTRCALGFIERKGLLSYNNSPYQYEIMGSKHNTNLLYKAIKTGNINSEVSLMLSYYITAHMQRVANSGNIAKTIRRVVSKLSKTFRERFGAINYYKL